MNAEFPTMQTAILVLLAVVVLVLLWLVFQSQRKTSDTSIVLIQQEVQSLRGQLSDAMLKNQDTVNQQLAQISIQVNNQLGQVAQQLQKSTTYPKHSPGQRCARGAGGK